MRRSPTPLQRAVPPLNFNVLPVSRVLDKAFGPPRGLVQDVHDDKTVIYRSNKCRVAVDLDVVDVRANNARTDLNASQCVAVRRSASQCVNSPPFTSRH